MNKFWTLLLLFLATDIFGQRTDNQTTALTEKQRSNDTLPKVYYIQNDTSKLPQAWFLNGKFLSQTLIGSLDPKLIESINVVKDSIRIEGVDYYGQIHITTKNNYEPKAISLNDLKRKYTNLKNKATLFMVDGVLIKSDYDQYVVDENCLFSITVDPLVNAKENIDLAVIKIFTKTEENIKKATQIRIRGAEEIISK